MVAEEPGTHGKALDEESLISGGFRKDPSPGSTPIIIVAYGVVVGTQ